MRKVKISALIRVFGTISLLLLLSAITSCGGGGGGDDNPGQTPQDIAQALLEANWTIANGGSIVLDGTDVSFRYEGFSLDIEDGTYTTTNAGDLFPATGTWSWLGTSDSQVTTGNGKTINITVLTTTRIVFNFIKTDQNVAAGVPGNYVVNLKR